MCDKLFQIHFVKSYVTNFVWFNRAHIINDEGYVITSTIQILNKKLKMNKIHLTQIEAAIFRKLQQANLLVRTDCLNIVSERFHRKYRVNYIN